MPGRSAQARRRVQRTRRPWPIRRSVCLVANPVTLKSLGKAIKLAPEAVLNCNMARATARFMQDVAGPAPKTSLGSS